MRLAQPIRAVDDLLHAGDVRRDHDPVVLLPCDPKALAVTALDAINGRAQAEVDPVCLQVGADRSQKRRFVVT